MPKRKLTDEDFAMNPSLKELGLHVGDEYEFPDADAVALPETKTDESSNLDEGSGEGDSGDDGENGGGGSNNPPKKPPF